MSAEDFCHWLKNYISIYQCKILDEHAMTELNHKLKQVPDQSETKPIYLRASGATYFNKSYGASG